MILFCKSSSLLVVARKTISHQIDKRNRVRARQLKVVQVVGHCCDPYETAPHRKESTRYAQPLLRPPDPQQIIENRRRAEFITPIPKPKKRKGASIQPTLVFDEGKGLSTQEQQYDPTSIINEVRGHVDRWRALPNSGDWQVTPETARLLQHWRHHKFSGVRLFFCQVEAVDSWQAGLLLVVARLESRQQTHDRSQVRHVN
jgi:hypothetical protein